MIKKKMGVGRIGTRKRALIEYTEHNRPNVGERSGQDMHGYGIGGLSSMRLVDHAGVCSGAGHWVARRTESVMIGSGLAAIWQAELKEGMKASLGEVFPGAAVSTVTDL